MQLDSHIIKTHRDRNEAINSITSRSLFLPMGNPSESGSHILYYYRAVNELPEYVFDDKNIAERVQNKQVDNVVLIDDIMITGEQAQRYIKHFKKINCKKTLSLFFTTQEAIGRLISSADDISVNSVYVLDNRSKLFSRESFAFSNDSSKELKPLAKKMCMFYGSKLVKSANNKDLEYMYNYPLGFGNSQLTIGFNYNVPDNTLPIFWWDANEWFPVLKRNIKKKTIGNSEVTDEQYW